jgi:hypothetical protein
MLGISRSPQPGDGDVSDQEPFNSLPMLQRAAVERAHFWAKLLTDCLRFEYLGRRMRIDKIS